MTENRTFDTYNNDAKLKEKRMVDTQYLNIETYIAINCNLDHGYWLHNKNICANFI